MLIKSVGANFIIIIITFLYLEPFGLLLRQIASLVLILITLSRQLIE